MKIKRFFYMFIAVFMLMSTASYGALPKSLKPAVQTNEFQKIHTQAYNADEEVCFIVEVDGDAVLETDMAKTEGADYIKTKDAMKKEELILKTHSDIARSIGKETSSSGKIEASYTLLYNGFAIKAKYKDMQTIMDTDGVKNVYVAGKIKLSAYLAESAGLTGVTAPPAAQYTGKKQLVAVIDTEFKIDHEVFADDIENPKLSPEALQDIIDTGRLNAKNISATGENAVYYNEKIPYRYDYFYNSNSVSSSANPHGTHVAGIVDAVAPDAQLALLKITDNRGYLDEDCVFSALQDAVRLGADVVNLSIGAEYASSDAAPVWNENFSTASENGIFISCASGNSSRGFKNNEPLAENIDYSASGVPAVLKDSVSVASMRDNKTMRSDTSYGTDETLELKPDITAPGNSIVSAWYDGGYSSQGGTSMATPHISGVAAVINEYLTATGNESTGRDRYELIQNLMMSTAEVLYDGSVPVSPRRQGAGLVRADRAVQSKLILKGSDGKSAKISLKDGLNEVLDLSFTAENFGDSAVTVDSISVEVITDNYKSENGKNIVTNSVPLEIISLGFEPFTLNAGDKKPISVNVTLDKADLDARTEVFTNGFFIDGFIKMSCNDNSNVDVSIPFTRFYGDWTKARVFDSTIYDEGGCTLRYTETIDGKEVERILESFLYTDGINNKGEVVLPTLGYNGATSEEDVEYKYEYIGISPNNDGNYDSLNLAITPTRTIGSMDISITESGKDEAVFSDTSSAVLGKFQTATGESHAKLGEIAGDVLPTLKDGKYTLTFNAKLNYTNPEITPTEHILEFPFYIDNTPPEVLSAKVENGTVELITKDNMHLSNIEIVNLKTGKGVIYGLTNPVEGKQAKLNFKLSDIGADIDSLNRVYILVKDLTENLYANPLSCLTGEIHPELTGFTYNSSLGLLNLTFNSVSYKNENADCDMVLAFYNKENELIHINHKIVNSGAGGFFFADSESVSLRDAEYFKLLIWEKDSTLPFDTAKSVYIDDYR